MGNLTNTLIFILFIGSVILLQVYLSSAKSKYPGLLIPMLLVMLSIISVINIAVFDQSWMEIIGVILLTFALSNIPTVITMGIYKVVREKRQINNQLDKMNVQDL